MSDAVNKPEHYNQGQIECIDAMKIVLTPEEFRGYLKGNVFKYLWREKDKNGIEDLRKGREYYDRLIDLIDESEQQKAADIQSLKDYPFGKLKQPAWTPKIGDWVRVRKPADTRSDAVVWFEMMDEHDGKILQVEKIEYGAIVHDNLGFMFDWLEPAEQPIVKQSLTTEPDPGEGYRLLSKDPPEKLLDTDEGLFACGLDGKQWLSVNYSGGEQLPSVYYRRKIEPAKAPLNSDTIPEGYRKLNDSSEEPRQLGDLRWSVAEKRYVEISVDEIGYANRDNWAACRKVEPTVKQSLTLQPPDGWRWLERGELIRNGDKPVNGVAIPLFWIGTPCCNNQFILRRNKFEVGEKVVHGDCKSLSISVVGNILSDGWVDLVRDGVSTAYHVKDLAPYIEEAK